MPVPQVLRKTGYSVTTLPLTQEGQQHTNLSFALSSSFSCPRASLTKYTQFASWGSIHLSFQYHFLLELLGELFRDSIHSFNNFEGYTSEVCDMRAKWGLHNTFNQFIQEYELYVISTQVYVIRSRSLYLFLSIINECIHVHALNWVVCKVIHERTIMSSEECQ